MSKAAPINVLEGGGFMRKCSRCGRLKATFASDPKGHRGIGSVCWTCWTAAEPRKAAKAGTTKPEKAAPTPAPRRGRPRTGGVFLRGGMYWIRYTPAPGAKEVRESSGSRDRAVADRLLAERLCEIACAKNVREAAGPSQNLPTGDLKDERRRA